MSEPTPRQRDVLAAIDAYSKGHGYAPSVRALLEPLGLSSTNGIAEHLERLEANGLIVRDRRVARSIRITRRGREWLAATYHATQARSVEQ